LTTKRFGWKTAEEPSDLEKNIFVKGGRFVFMDGLGSEKPKTDQRELVFDTNSWIPEGKKWSEKRA